MAYTALEPGATIGVIAPAGPAQPEEVAAVEPPLARFGRRTRLYPSCHAQHPTLDFLAGDDALRLADLHAAFIDPTVAAIICLRGGYGSARLLDRIDAALIARNPIVPAA